jgi:uncharacterized protein involved in exopolysaccharide biosynthesis
MNDRQKAHAQPSFDTDEPTLPWQDLVASIFRHRRLVVTALGLAVLAGVVRGWTVPPTYKASSLLMVRDNRTRLAVSPDERIGPLLDTGSEQQINALITFMTSASLVAEVLDGDEADRAAANQVAVGPGLFARLIEMPSRLYRWMHDVPDPSPIEQRARAIAKGIVVTPVQKSNVFEVSVYSGSPNWSAGFANKLVAKAISKYTGLSETADAQKFYGDQRVLLAKAVDEAQIALSQFRQETGPELLTLNRDQLRDRIAQLEAARAATKTEIAELIARRETPPESIWSDATSNDPAAGIVVNPSVHAIKARLVELEIKRSELISRYALKSAMISDVDRQIAEARRLLAQERTNTIEIYRKDANARIDAAEARVTALSNQLAEYRIQLSQYDTIAPEWERLQNELDTRRDAYQTYLRKEEEARFSSALDESQILNITVAQPAVVPREPEASPVLKYVVLGAGLGLLVGMGLALLRDWLDPSVKSTSQAERLTGVPVLGEIAL